MTANRNGSAAPTSSDLLSAEAVVALLNAATSLPSAADTPLERILASEELSADRSEEIERAVRQLQGTHAHLQRRTQELAALFSTARELASLHDVDTVLQLIVERAHDIIGTDVTYLSEIIESSGGMAVRHSVGTVSSPFRNLIVPAGKGLASKVIGGRLPVWVSRYADMNEAPRDPGIDAAVAAEGLVSFLGVPLVADDDVLGALFACNRFSHDFTPEQVLLLSAFADHAAAVLNSARLLRRSHEAADRAERAYAELEDHVSQVERASVVHERLTSVVVAGGGVAEVATILAGALDGPVVVLDAQLRRLDGHPVDHEPLDIGPVVREGVSRSRRTGRCVDVTVDGGAWTVVALVGTDALLGAIATKSGAATFGAVERRMLERAAHIASLLSLKREAASLSRAERRSRVLASLLDGVEPAAGDPMHELEALGAPVSAAAALQVSDAESAAVLHRLVDLVADSGMFIVRGRHVIVLWAGDRARERTELLRESLESLVRAPVTAVVADGITEAGEVVGAVTRAERALGLMPSLGVRSVTVAADAYAPYTGLVSSEADAAHHFVDELLGPVIAWDLRRRTDLMATLAAYFTQGESGSAAARTLHVHKNTVQQRLERVQELTAGDWRDPEYRFRLHAAVRLHDLRLRSGHEAPPWP